MFIGFFDFMYWIEYGFVFEEYVFGADGVGKMVDVGITYAIIVVGGISALV